ncbi:MAG: methionyl-tRNA formyltransferase [Candidatus Cloacimonadota bacterium]|nr:methionyl-tRNA formyltransferase [Candidatus Cloacimonadota bacterium]
MLIRKIVFMGTPDFAVPVLSKLARSKFKPQYVITQPDRPKGRKRKLKPPPVKVVADSFNIKTLQPVDVNDEETMRILNDYQPDIIITVAYGGYLKKEIRILPKLGCINLHPSLLPKYRGPAPINYTLFNGDEETGNTIFKIRAKIDSGKILFQTKTDVTPDDDYTTLQDRLAVLGADDLINCLQLLEKDEIDYLSQNHKKATFTQKIKKSDTFIDWEKMTAKQIHNLVRGLAKKPGAVASFRGKRMKLILVEVLNDCSEDSPGTVVEIFDKKGFRVTTIDKEIIIEELQPAGKRIMKSFEYDLGANVKIGEKFGKGF